MQYITKVVTYNSKEKMERGIIEEQKQSWEFVSTTVIQGSYGCAKTGCLGCIFIPLALLGKKGDIYQVSFKRPIAYTEKPPVKKQK